MSETNEEREASVWDGGCARRGNLVSLFAPLLMATTEWQATSDWCLVSTCGRTSLWSDCFEAVISVFLTCGVDLTDPLSIRSSPLSESLRCPLLYMIIWRSRWLLIPWELMRKTAPRWSYERRCKSSVERETTRRWEETASGACIGIRCATECLDGSSTTGFP